jgi:hypothetical protein
VLKQAAFRIKGDAVYITNADRARSIVLLVVAAHLVAFPLIRGYLPKDLYVAYEQGDDGIALWCLGIFLCLSAAFWWSVVVIDAKAGEVVIRRRWGLSCSESRYALSSAQEIALRKDAEGCVSIYLEGPALQTGLEVNHNKALVWDRASWEAEAIARDLARHLELPVRFHYPPG